VIKIVLFSMPKPLSDGKETRFTDFSSLMVFGPSTPTSSKKKLKDSSRASSPVLTITKIAISMLASTPPLMTMVKIPSLNPSPKTKFQQLLTP
jgi:hypothetical protein